MKVLTAVKMPHYLLYDKAANANQVIDATAGNGKDTLFLARYTSPSCKVLAFDIQKQALINAEQLLRSHNLERKVQFINDSHVRIADYCLPPVDIIMYNLGYLPGGEHTITTLTETTLAAVQASLNLLAPGGLISIAAYLGHSEGQREADALKRYLETIPQTEYSVACWQMVNQINRPPILYVIEKLRGNWDERTPPHEDKGNN